MTFSQLHPEHIRQTAPIYHANSPVKADKGPFKLYSVTDKTKEALYGLVIATIAFLVYANSLGNGFVGDDHSIIIHNPVLRDTPLSLFSRIDTTNENQLLPYYRPLTYLTYHLEWRLHNFNPLLVRLVNILLHSANAFLVYRLVRTFITSRFSAFLAGILFAIHPLATEAVDYNSARNTLLSCFFILAAYLIHRRGIIHGSISLTLAGALLFLASLFSKETSLAALPFVIALEASSFRNRSDTLLRTIIRLAPYAVGTVLYLVLRWSTLSRLGIQSTILPGIDPTEHIQSLYTTTDLATRLMQNLYVIPRYLVTIINPTALSPRYIVPADFTSNWLPLSLAWLCIIAGLAWILTKGRTRGTLFGLSWLILFWLPTCGIIYFPSAPLADRFLYAPAIGLWLIVADLTQRFLPDSTTMRRYFVLITIPIICTLSVITARRNLDWKSDLTLNIRMVEQYPDNPHGHIFLGSTYIGSNNLDLAEHEYMRALQLDPGLMAAHTPLGYIKMRREDFNGALYHYEKTLTASPTDRDARINSAIALEKLGRLNEAREAYRYYASMPGYNNIPGSLEYAEERIRTLSTVPDAEKQQ